MPNQLNKDRNKIKGKDGIHTAQEILILAQQAERRRRFQQIAEGHRSTEEFLEDSTTVEFGGRNKGGIS